MVAAVADTHALHWYLFNDPRLSNRARAFMESVATQSLQIAISSISMVELVYQIEKGRVPSTLFTVIARELADPLSMLIEIPVTLPIARAMSRIPISQIPDMPDRIIAATALYLDVPIISRDGKIQLSSLQTIW